VAFPRPDRVARGAIWQEHLPEKAPLSSDVDVEQLANRYELTGGLIKNAVLMAAASAAQRGGKCPTITQADLEAAAKDQTIRLADGDGEPLSVPAARLHDLVVPNRLRASLDELVDAARNRRQVLERWGIGAHSSYGKGIAALLHGPPGTGKTLCAEAIAGELSRPLLIASLAGLLSRWVGGTEQNLEQCFHRAKANNAVLFLDEADSLLRDRADHHVSRHSHRVVNLLLTLIERNEGVVLLATNQPDRLDGALSRRLTWRLAFPMPDEAARAEIWRRLIPDTVPTAANLRLQHLARCYELSGAQIRNAVFKAAYRAARSGDVVTCDLLDLAAREEVGESRAVVLPIMAVGGEA
jgi:SpoVK/Ycf46/Vps4 family AAA+-type ATPase